MSICRDLRYGWRMLAKDPVFTVAAVLTLAVGIGLSSAVFSVVNALLLRPAPVAAPAELVRIYSVVPGDLTGHAPLALADYEEIRDQCASFAGAVAYSYAPLALERGGESRLVMGTFASGSFFPVLGVEAALGRVFGEVEDRVDDADPIAVLSHLAWQRRFGSDPGVVGETLRLNGQPVTVIGVAPREFTGLTRGVSPELWLPLGLSRALRTRSAASAADAAAVIERGRREERSLWVIGRLAAGVRFEQAAAEVAVLAAKLRREFPNSHHDRDFVALPASRVRILPAVDGRISSASFAALMVVSLVLLIASVNLANMLLARAADRRREIATRLSLGAGPGAVACQLLTESLLLALLGGILGLGVALASNAALGRLRLPVPVDLAFGLTVDGRVFAFTLVASAATALVFGLAPALDAARTDLAGALRAGAGAAGSRGNRLCRRGLVIAQVAIALLLLICAGLALRSLRNARSLDPGFDPSGAVVATFAPHLQGYAREAADAFADRLVEEVRALPIVTAAGLASHLPLTLEMSFEKVAVAGREAPPERWPTIDAAAVGPGYFAAMAMPVRHGRGFDDRDGAGGSPVVVVNEAFAVRFLGVGAAGAGEAVGRELRIAGSDGAFEVVGIVGDAKVRTLGEPPRPFLYRARAQSGGRLGTAAGVVSTGAVTLVARVDGDPRAALQPIREVARTIDGAVAVSRLTTLDEALAPALWPPRLAAALFGLFGLVGLLLAAVGIYGVMAHGVSRRRREIGIRLALGARRRDVRRLILGEGLTLTALGLASGLAAAVAVTRVLRSLLYGVSATDATTFAAVSILLAAVALAASYLPALRASNADPLLALREE